MEHTHPHRRTDFRTPGLHCLLWSAYQWMGQPLIYQTDLSLFLLLGVISPERLYRGL